MTDFVAVSIFLHTLYLTEYNYYLRKRGSNFPETKKNQTFVEVTTIVNYLETRRGGVGDREEKNLGVRSNRGAV